jgi:uncharacterized protein (DUF342 family)
VHVVSDESASKQPKPKYLKPTLCFTQKLMRDEEGDFESTLLVSELVKPAQLLANFENVEKFEKRGFTRCTLQAGEHVSHNEEEDRLEADIYGYPRIATHEPEGHPPVTIISLIPLVKVSFDKLSATLVIFPAIEGCFGLRLDNLDSLLQEIGIIHGIAQLSREKAQQAIAARELDKVEIPIATGHPPGAGQDAYLTFAMEIGPIAGQLLEDGSIDFRERKIMIGVKEGDLIATKVPAVPGAPGANVFGEILESKTGKDVKVKVSGDVTFSEETLEIRATRDGVLSVVNKSEIKVSSRLAVNSDVDFSTGNINSEGCLSISGSIQPGFSVSSGGDVLLSGSVMSATLSSGGNAVIKGGITGKKSVVQVSGDVDMVYIEQGTLQAGGLIVIRSQAYFSTVTAQRDIRCQANAKIMGGALIAGQHLSVGTVGSEKSDTALLAAGVDPNRYLLYIELQKHLERQQEELIQWLQLHGSSRARKLRKLENAVAETKSQLLSINLIPGTELHSRSGTGATREEMDEISPLYHQGLDVDAIRITVHETVHAGTVIMLGNRSMVLDKHLSQREFKLSGDMKRIISLPIKT